VVLVQPEIKCEYENCTHNAKIRAIKKEKIRVFNSLDDYDKSTIEIETEMFVCAYHAKYLQDRWEIKQWIVEKIPYDILFTIDPKWTEYAQENNLSYWDIVWERDLRWKEQKFCIHCGNKLIHEIRRYPCDDGYDSPNQWTEDYKTIICYNCGFFNWNSDHIRGNFSRKEESEGKYSEYGNPKYDPDYKKWKEVLKTLEKEKNEIGSI
jgi:hypothetical protein